MTIREYQPEDWLHTRRIHDRARPIELEGSCDPRAFVPLEEDKQDLAEFRQAKKYVAMVDQQIAGFIGVHEKTIGWLYVEPDLAGRGTGRRLLRHAMAFIGSSIEVYVLSGNVPALGLYKSEGFEEIERFKSDNNGYPCTVIKLQRT